MSVCDKHKLSPARIYAQCIGCEIDGLRAENKRLQAIVDAAQRIDNGEQFDLPQPHHKLISIVAGNRATMKSQQKEIERLQAKVATAQTAACNAIRESQRLQAIVDGMEAVSRGDYVVEYGWNSETGTMGYWWGKRGSFVSDRLTWAGTSRQDAWLIIGKKAAEKAIHQNSAAQETK